MTTQTLKGVQKSDLRNGEANSQPLSTASLTEWSGYSPKRHNYNGNYVQCVNQETCTAFEVNSSVALRRGWLPVEGFELECVNCQRLEEI